MKAQYKLNYVESAIKLHLANQLHAYAFNQLHAYALYA